MATTWLMNFNEIEAAIPASADLLRFSAFLDPDSIPLTLIIAGREQLGPLLSSALAGADHDRLVLDILLQPLTSYSLIRREPGSESYNLHRMVQEAVRGRMDEADCRAWAERAVLAINEGFPTVEYETWPLCDRLFPHAAAAARLTDKYEFESIGSARLLNQVGFYNRERGRYAEAEPLYKRALTISEKVLGPDHPHAATSLNNLSELYWLRGKYEEAELLEKRALGIREKALGPHHASVATCLSNLAELYRVQGRYEEAELLLKRALGISEEVLGPDHPDIAIRLNILALLYSDKGRYQEADSLHKRALGIREKALGPDHPDVATSLNNLAFLYDHQRRYDEAEPLYKRALLILETALGPDHPSTVICRNNPRLLHEKQGRTSPPGLIQ